MPRRSTARAGGPFVGRPGLADYLALGYVPLDHDDGFICGPAATTLEYALADFAIGRFAQAIGRDSRQRVRAAVGELASAVQPGHPLSRAAPRQTAPSRPGSRTPPRTASSRATRLSTRGSSRTTSPGWPLLMGGDGSRAEPARPLPCRPRREPSRTVRLARQRAELRHALALQLARCAVADAGGRAAGRDDALPAAPGRPARRRRSRRAVGVVRLERARPLPRHPGRGRAGGREPALSERHDQVAGSAGSGWRRRRPAPAAVCSRSETRRRALRTHLVPDGGSARREDAAIRASLRSRIGAGARRPASRPPSFPKARGSSVRPVIWWPALGALIGVRLAIPLVALAWLGTRPAGAAAVRLCAAERRLVRVLRGRPGSDLGRRAMCRSRSRSLSQPAVVALAVYARRTWRTPRRWLGLLVGGGAIALTAAAVVHEMTPPGAPVGRLAADLVDPAGAVPARGRALRRRRLRHRPRSLPARDRRNRRRHGVHRPLRQRTPVGRAAGGCPVHGLAVPRAGGRGRERVGERAVARRRRPPPVHGAAVDGPRRRRPRARPALARRTWP